MLTIGTFWCHPWYLHTSISSLKCRIFSALPSKAAGGADWNNKTPVQLWRKCCCFSFCQLTGFHFVLMTAECSRDFFRVWLCHNQMGNTGEGMRSATVDDVHCCWQHRQLDVENHSESQQDDTTWGINTPIDLSNLNNFLIGELFCCRKNIFIPKTSQRIKYWILIWEGLSETQGSAKTSLLTFSNHLGAKDGAHRLVSARDFNILSFAPSFAINIIALKSNSTGWRNPGKDYWKLALIHPKCKFIAISEGWNQLQ